MKTKTILSLASISLLSLSACVTTAPTPAPAQAAPVVVQQPVAEPPPSVVVTPHAY